MKKTFKKIIASISVVTIIILSGLVTVTLSPQLLFAKKIEHQAFTIYATADNDIDEVHFKHRLDEAYALIKQSELHDEDFHFKILLTQDHFFNDIEDLRGKGPIARATAGYTTIKVSIVPKENYAWGNNGKVNLKYLLAHELIHNLQAHKYGLLNFSPIKHPPLWKLEGYPEYVARQDQLSADDYSLKAEVQRYARLIEASEDMDVEVTQGHFMPFYYYKGGIMVEYLIDVKGMTYDEILKDDRSEDSIYQEVLQLSEAS
jgi:hypothetical protein